MIETLPAFFGILDRIKNLLQLKKNSKRECFVLFAEPIFKEMGPVADDYFRLIHKARSAVEKSQGENWSSSLMELRTSRDQMWVARQNVAAFADAIAAEMSDKKHIDFAIKVKAFFYAPDNRSVSFKKCLDLSRFSLC